MRPRILRSILLYASEIGPANEMLAAAVRDLPADAPADVRARLLANLSRALMELERDAEAVETADKALAIAERLDLDEIVADALNNKAAALVAWADGARRPPSMRRRSRSRMPGDTWRQSCGRSNRANQLHQQDPARSLGMQLANLNLPGGSETARWRSGLRSLRCSAAGLRAETGTPARHRRRGTRRV